MTLLQLKLFAVVAKHQNMTKASREVHLSQSAISQQLKLLEKECGIKLFNKASRGIKLTEAGCLFLPDVELILSQVERLKEKFNKTNIKKAS
jgi:DNA-binding transcriptional LysR family regulator